MVENGWQAYVDDNLLGSGKVSKAAILGQQGGVRAASTGYTLSPEEQQAIPSSSRSTWPPSGDLKPSP